MVTSRANIYGPLDGGIVILTLPLEVFTQRNFVADFIIINISLSVSVEVAQLWQTLFLLSVKCFAANFTCFFVGAESTFRD